MKWTGEFLVKFLKNDVSGDFFDIMISYILENNVKKFMLAIKNHCNFTILTLQYITTPPYAYFSNIFVFLSIFLCDFS